MVVDARLDLTMHTLSLGLRVNELPTIYVGMIPIVAAAPKRIIVTFIGHIILLSGELQATQSPKVEIFPTKWAFGIMKVQVGLWRLHQ